MEEALCQRSITILHKSTFLQKTFFLRCFELCGVLDTNIRSGLDLEPFGGARIWTVLYVNSFAKMVEKALIEVSDIVPFWGLFGGVCRDCF